MGEEDVQITMALLEEVKPEQIFCAGDLADPHGTHKVCLDVVLESLRRIKEKKAQWIKDCWLWLYKGAWQEWNIDEIEMAVPMSPEQVLNKRYGIFIHQSQKDMVPFQGSDTLNKKREEQHEHNIPTACFLVDKKPSRRNRPAGRHPTPGLDAGAAERLRLRDLPGQGLHQLPERHGQRR